MTRVKISSIILAAMIILSVVSGIWVNNSCNNIIELIDAVSEENFENNNDNAFALVSELEEYWKKFRKIANIMVKSDKLSEIDRINSRIAFLLKNDSDELESELSELRNMIILLRDGERPIFTSVF